MRDYLREKKAKAREKALLKRIGEAIRDYGMIKKGDRICVAVSGGEDSLSLLKILSSETIKKSFDCTVMALHIETDFHCKSCTHKEKLADIFEKWNVPYEFGYAEVVGSAGGKKVNCFWCSWNKRKSIFQICDKLNINKIAFGHHKDDVVETMLLNLFFNGEISTMNPKQDLFNGKISIIRPLCYIEKKDITAYAKLAGIEAKVCKCPFGDNSKRKYVRGIIEAAAKESKSVKSNIFRAPSRIREEYLGKVLK